MSLRRFLLVHLLADGRFDAVASHQQVTRRNGTVGKAQSHTVAGVGVRYEPPSEVSDPVGEVGYEDVQEMSPVEMNTPVYWKHGLSTVRVPSVKVKTYTVAQTTQTAAQHLDDQTYESRTRWLERV